MLTCQTLTSNEQKQQEQHVVRIICLPTHRQALI